MRDFWQRRARGGPPILYALLDAGLVAPEAMPSEAEAMARGGVDVVQLRCKSMSGRRLHDLARSVHEVLHARSIPLILDDRVDVALCAGVEGVHLGEEDLPVAAARELLGPEAWIGRTAHDARELAEVDPQADYVGVGAAFPTRTRPGSAVCGPAALTLLAAGTSLPVIAIGGLGPDNVRALEGSTIAGVAVGSAISPVRGGGEALATLRRRLDRWPRPASAGSASPEPPQPHR